MRSIALSCMLLIIIHQIIIAQTKSANTQPALVTSVEGVEEYSLSNGLQICFSKLLFDHNIINNSSDQNASFLVMRSNHVAMKICSTSE